MNKQFLRGRDPYFWIIEEMLISVESPIQRMNPEIPLDTHPSNSLFPQRAFLFTAGVGCELITLSDAD